jgi:hypothetical protein
MSEKQENDAIQYRTNSVPRAIRLIWTIFLTFAAVYMVKYFWPDLMLWVSKLR